MTELSFAQKAVIHAEAIGDAIRERDRQRFSEGFTLDRDDLYQTPALAQAAACYTDPDGGKPPARWPWKRAWWKPKTRRQDLVRAGALIIAEIERLDRAAKREELGK